MELQFLFAGDLIPAVQAFIRSAYGLLLIATLVLTLGPSRWFFTSGRYGGYAKPDRITDTIQNPVLLPVILVLWFACGVMLAIGRHTVLFSFLNLLLCRYFFIHMRWKGILRGMGAPGFLTYWLGACVFFLEYGLHMDPGGTVRSAALNVFRVDFAAIMLSAGAYKLLCGYPANEGMEYGMVNPWWGYWWRYYKRLPAGHILFRFLNHMAYGTEIVAAILMLIPPTAVIGAWLIILSFVFIATQIRLGFLCEMVIVGALIFMRSGSYFDHFVHNWIAEPGITTVAATPGMQAINSALTIVLWTYLVLLPLAHAGLWYNFLGRKSLPPPLQRILEIYTNFFGIIIWRVFTIDVVNFFADIYVQDRESGPRKLYSHFGAFDRRSRFRYNHVGEFVCLASVFTTLKYYPSNSELFQERILRYAATVPCPPGSRIVFEYRSIKKSSRGFEFVPVLEYVVDVYLRTVDQRVIDQSFSFRAGSSPVHEGARPGSYAPLTA
ncbi:MAG TPA: hypothetical protein VIB79_26260 [Candidatus Binatia bacterium]|jgi:hypothetical protein